MEAEGSPFILFRNKFKEREPVLGDAKNKVLIFG